MLAGPGEEMPEPIMGAPLVTASDESGCAAGWSLAWLSFGIDDLRL